MIQFVVLLNSDSESEIGTEEVSDNSDDIDLPADGKNLLAIFVVK